MLIITAGFAGAAVIRHLPSTLGAVVCFHHDEGVDEAEFSQLPIQTKTILLSTKDNERPNSKKRGRQTLEHSLESLAPELAMQMKGAKKIGLVAGLGGILGTTTASFVSRLASELKIPLVASVSLPFAFEGAARIKAAEAVAARIEKQAVASQIVKLEDRVRESGEDVDMDEFFVAVGQAHAAFLSSQSASVS